MKPPQKSVSMMNHVAVLCLHILLSETIALFALPVVSVILGYAFGVTMVLNFRFSFSCGALNKSRRTVI